MSEQTIRKPEFQFQGLGTPMERQREAVEEELDIRVTLTSSDTASLAILADKIEASLGSSASNRSKIQKTSNGRIGMSLGFSRRSIGLPEVIVPSRTTSVAPQQSQRVPTDEQELATKEVLALEKGESITLRAYAGTGKTWFLRHCTTLMPTWRFLYLAFNSPIAEEARKSFPRNVECVTTHSLAMKQIRRTGREDLGIATRPEEAAQIAQIPTRLGTMNQRTAARFALETLEAFCNSASPTLEYAHVPNNPKIALAGLDERILAYARRIWEAMIEGKLPLSHSAYLKLWQTRLVSGEMQPPSYDGVLFDEAQDTNPVTASIISHMNTRIIRVGDSFQQIYTWRGAIDALEDGQGKQLYLTKSFRFGKNIAHVANNVLKMHPNRKARTAPPVMGMRDDEQIALFGDTDAVLCRSNAGLFEESIQISESGRSIFILGGIRDLQALVEGAADLYGGGRATRGAFSEYPSWEEAVHDVEAGMAREISFIVKRVEQKGIASLQNDLATIKRMHVDESHASTTLSTIHKAKGREWESVRLNKDLSSIDEIRDSVEKAETERDFRAIGEEVNLVYVAVTRAKVRLVLPLGLAPLHYDDFKFEPQKKRR